MQIHTVVKLILYMIMHLFMYRLALLISSVGQCVCIYEHTHTHMWNKLRVVKVPKINHANTKPKKIEIKERKKIHTCTLKKPNSSQCL